MSAQTAATDVRTEIVEPAEDHMTLEELKAWILAQGDDVFAIPGTTKAERVRENLGAMDLRVSEEEEREIRALAGRVAGGRFLDRDVGPQSADTPLPDQELVSVDGQWVPELVGSL